MMLQIAETYERMIVFEENIAAARNRVRSR